MKRLFCFLLVAFAALAQPPQARIKIDTDRRIGDVDKLLFGNFAEHLGRMIYGGVYEEGSPLSDEDGYRKDVMAAVKKMGVSILRYPGGNFASGYNWKDGIGPKNQRPVRPEMAWNDIETNRFPSQLVFFSPLIKLFKPGSSLRGRTCVDVISLIFWQRNPCGHGNTSRIQLANDLCPFRTEIFCGKRNPGVQFF